MERGQVFYVDFGDGIGSEQGGSRPAVIVQNNVGNRYSPTLIVAPITTQVKTKLPTHVDVYSLRKTSIILCEQIRVVDKSRVRDYIGKLSTKELTELNNALKVSLGV